MRKTSKSKHHFIGLLVIMFGVVACSGLPKQQEKVSFVQAKNQFAAHQGKPVQWLGRILKVSNLRHTTTVEMMAIASRYSNTEGNDLGRFIARFNGFKDPAQFSVGRTLSVHGTLQSQRKRKIGGYTYLYPVVAVTKHTLFSKPSSAPKVQWHIGWSNRGHGVGIGF